MKGNFETYRSRIDVISGLIMLAFLVLLVHLFDIQILQHSELQKIAKTRSHIDKMVSGNRGLIFDRNFNVLTQNITRYTFWVNTLNPLENSEELISLFSETFGKPKSYYRNLLLPGKKYIPLAKDILEPECLNILAAMPIQGLNRNSSIERYYPYPNIASQLIGYTHPDGSGATGVECSRNSILTGEKAKKVIQRNGSGEMTTSLYHDLPEYSNGANLQLTIDVELQSILYDELADAQDKSGAVLASGIILDPYSGEILAMATAPGFDLNHFGSYPIKNYMNDVLSTSYEPGSTFKIVTLAAALETGKVTPWKMYYCENGTYNLPNRVLHDHKKHGNLTVSEILSNSSNIGMSKIANDIGSALIYNYARDFGFGVTTGIGLPSESPGCLKPYSEWTDYSGASIAMGQEMSATTLQMAMAYCVIANGGFLMMPRIIKNLYNTDGSAEMFPSRVIRQVVSSQTTDEIMQMLIKVVECGTGTNARIDGYPVAGKTGTAQKFIDGKYSAQKYMSSFVGIFPADAPEYVCVVTVDSPKYGNHWGNATAAPVVRKVFERIINMGHGVIKTNESKRSFAEYDYNYPDDNQSTSLAEIN